MKWQELLQLLGGEPLFHVSVLLSGLKSQAGARPFLKRFSEAALLRRENLLRLLGG